MRDANDETSKAGRWKRVEGNLAVVLAEVRAQPQFRKWWRDNQ
jgi:hypothetical protein